MHNAYIRSMILALAATPFLSAAIAFPRTNSGQTGDGTETVYKPGQDGVTIPKAIHQTNPEYTDSARRKKINGTVVLSMIVTAQGTVRDPKVTQSLDKDLDKQAIACVKQWKFQPATKDGTPVAVHVDVEVDFHLY